MGRRGRRRREMGFWEWLQWVLYRLFGDRDLRGRTS